MEESSTGWDGYVTYLTRATDLVRNAYEENNYMKTRIETLEAELEIWKQGHRAVILEKEILERRIGLEGEPVALVVIDGDSCVFHRDLLTKGREGAQMAINLLIQAVNNALEGQDTSNLQYVVHVLYNRFGLTKALKDLEICPSDVLGKFVLGFNALQPLFLMTDVGSIKEAADSKLRELIKFYGKLPSCKLILAGCSDTGYNTTISALQGAGVAKNLHFIKGHSDFPDDLDTFNIPVHSFPMIFEPYKLPGATSVPPTPATPGRKDRASPDGGKARRLKRKSGNGTSDSESDDGFFPVKPKGVVFIRNGDGSKVLDTRKALSKQTVNPCNAFYLTEAGCQRGDCKFCHEYALTIKQLKQLSLDAKKSPCPDALKGRPCTDKNCVAGKICPYGRKCRFDDCRFYGPGMHGEDVEASSD